MAALLKEVGIAARDKLGSHAAPDDLLVVKAIPHVSPPRPLLRNGGNIGRVYLITAVTGTCIGGDSYKFTKPRKIPPRYFVF